MQSTLRRVAAEGAVLLENNGILPLAEGTKISLFGRVQYNWFYIYYICNNNIFYLSFFLLRLYHLEKIHLF